MSEETQEAVSKFLVGQQDLTGLKDRVIDAAKLYRRSCENQGFVPVETAGNYLDALLTELDRRLKGPLSERLEKVEATLTPKQHKALVSAIEQAEFGAEAS